jgi:hypothetical protein
LAKSPHVSCNTGYITCVMNKTGRTLLCILYLHWRYTETSNTKKLSFSSTRHPSVVSDVFSRGTKDKKSCVQGTDYSIISIALIINNLVLHLQYQSDLTEGHSTIDYTTVLRRGLQGLSVHHRAESLHRQKHHSTLITDHLTVWFYHIRQHAKRI